MYENIVFAEFSNQPDGPLPTLPLRLPPEDTNFYDQKKGYFVLPPLRGGIRRGKCHPPFTGGGKGWFFFPLPFKGRAGVGSLSRRCRSPRRSRRRRTTGNGVPLCHPEARPRAEGSQAPCHKIKNTRQRSPDRCAVQNLSAEQQPSRRCRSRDRQWRFFVSSGGPPAGRSISGALPFPHFVGESEGGVGYSPDRIRIPTPPQSR